MLVFQSLPLKFWTLAIAYIDGNLVDMSLVYPFIDQENTFCNIKFLKVKQYNTQLKAFGRLGHTTNVAPNKAKLVACAHKCALLGYELGIQDSRV